MSEFSGSVRSGSTVLFENVPVAMSLKDDNLYATTAIEGSIEVPDVTPILDEIARGNSAFTLILNGMHQVSISFSKIKPNPGSAWVHFESAGPVSQV